ncbi:hypothetical protein O3S80_27740 [Streptomyces sp. Lzd4kr]|nr:hypothetical protein [Streptomyces sp. Lzd4kr]
MVSCSNAAGVPATAKPSMLSAVTVRPACRACSSACSLTSASAWNGSADVGFAASVIGTPPCDRAAA